MVRSLRPYIIGFLIIFLFAVLFALEKIDLALRDAMIVLLGYFPLSGLGAELIFAYRHDALHISKKVLTRNEKPLAFWANVSGRALFFAIMFYIVARHAIRLASGIDINGPIGHL